MTTQILGIKCDGGHYTCSPPKECCKQGCCYISQTSPGYRPPALTSGNVFNPLFLGHWYFWLAVTATVAGILCACSLWKKHSQHNASSNGAASSALFCCTCGDEGGLRDEHTSEPDSNGSCYAPPQYSRCNSFLQAPPPYSEVTSKPDLYPLVISYNAEPIIKNNHTNTGGYLMVQYFRNFIVRPATAASGTISATSTFDSLSSSFICVNEAIPPPYSASMASLDEEQSEENSGNASATINTENIRNLPLSTSFNSLKHFGGQQESKAMNRAPRPQSVVSIRNNPCFVQQQNNVPINDEINQPKPIETYSENKTATTAVCDNRKLKLSKLMKAAERSSEEDDNYFTDLLNLSVCVPTAQATAPIAAAQPNASVTTSMTGSDISSLAYLGTPDSPPRATSPTMEMKEILDRIQQLPQQSRSPQPPVEQGTSRSKSYFHKTKAKTMYMPLLHNVQLPSKTKNTPNVFSKSWLSRSAPNTPCGSFMPTFPVINKTSSKNSKLDDGSALLLTEEEHDEDDYSDNEQKKYSSRDERL